MAETTLEQTALEAGEFSVVPELCIACDACCQDFPEVFYMGDDAKAHTLDDQQASLHNARTVVDICPTAAIEYSGELPPALLEIELEEIVGWEASWAPYRDAPEDTRERDRRYGRDYSVDENSGYVKVTLQLPTRVPNVRDRFRFGAPETMPEYRTHVTLDGKTLSATGWVPRISPSDKVDVKVLKAKIRKLTHTSSSFPGRFTTTWDFPDKDVVGMKYRHDAHGKIEMLVFTDKAKMDAWQWKAHFITDECTSCSICERVCPTNAISSGERYFIDPDLCINCSVCGVYCPFDAIDDSAEVLVEKIKPKQVPKALVHEELCTGCEFCVDVCPFEALEMKALEDNSLYSLPQTSQVAIVIDKNCVSCKLCEQVCIKDAIEVPRPHQFEDIGMSFMSYVMDDH
ncbi:MAG: electron transport complex protein RnfB [Planctomycetota bacterium]|jgi:electron transport complex protein RnfB